MTAQVSLQLTFCYTVAEGNVKFVLFLESLQDIIMLLDTSQYRGFQ